MTLPETIRISGVRPHYARFAATAAVMAFLCVSCHSRAVAAGWSGGAASVAITPEGSLLLEGYVPAKVATEKIHDVHAKALALRDPMGNRMVIVTADLSGYDYGFTDGIAKEAKKRWGLSRESILFNASHTHSGPAIMPEEWQLLYGHSPEESAKVGRYIPWAAERFVTVIGEAIANMGPVEVTFSSANPVPFAMSRRYPTEKGIVYRSGPGSQYGGGPRDDTVPVLRVVAPDGKLKAVLFGYACHPITLNGEKFSADYPGFAQQYIEEAFPGSVALFMQGCAGELVPNARFQVEYAMGHGRALAEAVKNALSGPQVKISGPIRSAYSDVPLEFESAPDRTSLEAQLKSDNATLVRKARYLLDTLDRNGRISTTLPCPLQTVRFGPELLLVGISGETVADYALTIKSEHTGQFTWVTGYCNYVYAYLPTWRILREGGYEGGEAIRYSPFPGPFREDVETRVLSGVRNLVRQVSSR